MGEGTGTGYGSDEGNVGFLKGLYEFISIKYNALRSNYVRETNKRLKKSHDLSQKLWRFPNKD